MVIRIEVISENVYSVDTLWTWIKYIMLVFLGISNYFISINKNNYNIIHLYSCNLVSIIIYFLWTYEYIITMYLLIIN